ncbi:uncharacterized protein DS421_15g509390 [Arachis hypogaea]|nr:uncharacterized protein DS421_15g509390 [Arachis hypogaea]
METWELLERLLGARPPVAPQQAAQRNESFTLKFVWLRDHIRQMPLTDDLETLRQYARTLGGVGRVLGIGHTGLDVPVTVLGGTPRRHEHR